MGSGSAGGGRGGRIAGAVNRDFHAADFAEGLAGLDRSKTYLVHCAAGGRSEKSVARMKELGFSSVLHLREGFRGWARAGLPVERP